MRTVLFFIIIGLTGFSSVYAKQNVFSEVKTIKVGSCTLDVYTAVTDNQKMTGMLAFDNDTFDQEGMIFVGKNRSIRKQSYHTVGMKLDIMIIGVRTIGKDEYIVYDTPKHSPPGIELIEFYGDSVLEIPVTLYNDKFKKCLITN